MFLTSVFQVWDARVSGGKWRKYCREDDDIEVCKLNAKMELCMCVCAAWLIGLPLARHFHYLIAWKGRRGDCRRLAVWAKRMDLECISIGSKAPAVGGCPRPLGLFMQVQVSCATSSLSSPLPGITLLSHSPHWKAPSDCTGAHTGSGSESSPYLDVYSEQWFATRPAPAGPHCSTSLSVMGAPAHLISPPWEGHLRWGLLDVSWAWKVVQITPGVLKHDKLFDTNAADILKCLYPFLHNRWYCWQPPRVIEAIVPRWSYLIGISMQWMSLCNCITVMYPLYSLGKRTRIFASSPIKLCVNGAACQTADSRLMLAAPTPSNHGMM